MLYPIVVMSLACTGVELPLRKEENLAYTLMAILQSTRTENGLARIRELSHYLFAMTQRFYAVKNLNYPSILSN